MADEPANSVTVVAKRGECSTIVSARSRNSNVRRSESACVLWKKRNVLSGSKYASVGRQY